MAVSYTHLDVYKRQPGVLRRDAQLQKDLTVGVGLRDGDLLRMLHQVLGHIGQKLFHCAGPPALECAGFFQQITDSLSAVSYTHLGSARFVYTPYENKTGKDSFTYVALDQAGNTSPEAKVTLCIEKPNTKVTYACLLYTSRT